VDPRDLEITELKAASAARDAQMAAKDARIAELERKVDELTQMVMALKEQLSRNSGNSNRPPSSDSPSQRGERRGKSKSERKHGGQPGHSGSTRALLPPEEVDELVHLFPPKCESCWKALPRTLDPSAQRFQTTEVPPVKPHTTEYRRHGVVCPCCHYKTWAPVDQIPVSPFGPRLSSTVALVTGVYHLGRRAAVSLLADFFGVRVSLGAVSSMEARVSEAVKLPVGEVWKKVEAAAVKHTDGTSWFQAGAMRSLWTIATTVATVFKIVANGKADTLKPLFGERRGILVSDRATALGFWAMELRQVCWAHLLRKFISFSECAGRAAVLGRELLDYLVIMFAYWGDLKAGRLSRAQFREQMAPLRKQLEAALVRVVAAKLPQVSGSCADILAHRAALWTFVDRDDVEPTNNHAERELRAFVLWRKRSFGTQSERGNLFAERLMTVAHTARKQKKSVLAFLTACCTAARHGTAAPSLFAPLSTAA
jgi:transposase